MTFTSEGTSLRERHFHDAVVPEQTHAQRPSSYSHASPPLGGHALAAAA
jgi:hypothetical protein